MWNQRNSQVHPRHEFVNHQENPSYCPLQILGWLLIGHLMTMYRILATKWNNFLTSEILPGLGLANPSIQ
jgi:hypothetical protein